MHKAQIRPLTTQPATGVVTRRSSATWLAIPLRPSAGNWAVQRVGYISGKIAMTQAIPPGLRSTSGVPGPPRPKPLKQSNRKSYGYAIPSCQVSRDGSVRESFETIWVDIKLSRCLHVARSSVSSSGIPGGDLRGKDHRPSRRRGGVTSDRPCSCRHKASQDRGETCLNTHGEKITGEARAGHQRTSADFLARCDKAPRECRGEKNIRKGA